VGKILGVTSKGVFVKFYSEKLIFLSLEKYSGPMTVNCINLKNIKNNFIEGQPVFWGNRILYLPSSRIIIPLDPSNIRRISLPVSTQKNIEFQHDRLQFYISLALQEKLLQSNYDQQQHSIKLIRLIKDLGLGSFSDDLYKIFDCFKSGRTEELLQSLSSIVGNGPGLTPLGDDIILGMILILNRWKQSINLKFDINLLNNEIINLTCQNSTLLSCKLIKCAVQGKADERIEFLADSLFTREKLDEEYVRVCLDWGATSGSGVLLGMAIVLESIFLN
jgi:hypothetical protein